MLCRSEHIVGITRRLCEQRCLAEVPIFLEVTIPAKPNGAEVGLQLGAWEPSASELETRNPSSGQAIIIGTAHLMPIERARQRSILRQWRRFRFFVRRRQIGLSVHHAHPYS